MDLSEHIEEIMVAQPWRVTSSEDAGTLVLEGERVVATFTRALEAVLAADAYNTSITATLAPRMTDLASWHRDDS